MMTLQTMKTLARTISILFATSVFAVGPTPTSIAAPSPTSTAAASTPNPTPAFAALVAGQYAGVLQSLKQVGGSFFGPNFTLSPKPTKWLLKLGRYKGTSEEGPVDLHGYWIFRTDVQMCWQAVQAGGGALQYWNQDGSAKGNPDERALFAFIPVDNIPNIPQAVKIRCIGGGGYFVNLVGDTFSCDDSEDHATIFIVEF
jgi:hypothetical protein